MAYSDTAVRYLTIEPSTTNQAHNIWYNKMNPSERFEVMQLVGDKPNASQKLNACLNYIEDHLEQFK